MDSSNFFELVTTVTTLEVLEKADISNFTAFYLGNPYCSKLEGNLLANFKDLKKGISYLKERAKKIYLSTPVIPSEKDFENIVQLLTIGESQGVDGIEVHDMGVLRVTKKFPLKIHLGVFANVYNRVAALKFQELGVKRIIPSQELTLEEIDELKSIPGLELELPIQGKLPLGVANACLLSLDFPSRKSLPCKQTCLEEHFLEFNGWKLRTKGMATFTGADLSMIEYLPLLLKRGYRFFRIEGLFEAPENLSRLGKIYRQAFEEIFQGHFNPQSKLQEIQKIVPDLCNGWYFGYTGREYLGGEIW